MDGIRALGQGTPPDSLQPTSHSHRPPAAAAAEPPSPAAPEEAVSSAPAPRPSATADAGDASPSRLAELTSAVASGTYAVDPHELAAAIIAALTGGRG